MMPSHYRVSPLYPAKNRRVARQAGPKVPQPGMTPAELGRLGGELSKAMVQAAADFMARKALNEVGLAFQQALDQKPDSHPSS